VRDPCHLLFFSFRDRNGTSHLRQFRFKIAKF